MKMNRFFYFLICCLWGAFSLSAASARETVDFNFGWKFYRGECDASQCTTSSFDDARWRKVDLPHDFQIEQEWIEPTKEQKKIREIYKEKLCARAFKAMDIGWYRKAVEVDRSWKGKRIYLDIAGIMYVGDVWLNGVKIGINEYGYLGKEYDLTDHIKWNGPNVVTVSADNRLRSRWYTGGGLYRKVNLIVKEPVAIARHGVFVSVPSISEQNASVKVQVDIDNFNIGKEPIQAAVQILDPNGKQVADGTLPITAEKGRTSCDLSLTVANPKMWSPETPRLYTVKVMLQKDGQTLDQMSDSFGIRTIEWNPDRGLVLNGKTVKFKGINVHHDFGALGAANYEAAIEARFKVFKEMGVNGIRLAHNPYDESYMKMADKHGIMLVAELFDKWERSEWFRADFYETMPWAVEEWVKSCRNRPSVIIYSLGNEVTNYQVDNTGKHQGWGVPVFNMLKAEALKADTSRKFTVGHYPARKDGIRRSDNPDDKKFSESEPPAMAFVSDVVSYNYTYQLFEKDRERYPNWIFFQSEATTAAMPENYFGMPEWSVGLAYWGAMQYLGESAGWPAKGWNRCYIDLSMRPMPLFYQLRSVFRNDPMVYIAVKKANAKLVRFQDAIVGIADVRDGWNHPQGAKVNLLVYSNADEVELFLNGKSIGTKAIEKTNFKKRNSTDWTVEYQPGELKAVARTAGKVVAEHSVETVEKPVALKLELENPAWKSDGFDLQHVRVSAVDEKGRVVNFANNLVKFSVEGPARIVAVDNGDISSNESFVGDQRSLHLGAALAILRAGKTPGDVVLKATAEGLTSAEISCKTRSTPFSPASGPPMSFLNGLHPKSKFLAHTENKNETRDLIVVAGQSNAVGFDASAAELPADESDKEVMFWWRCGDPPPDDHDSVSRGWTTLQPQPKSNPMAKHAGVARQYGNFSNPAGGFGPEMGFARELRATTHQPLAIVKVAFSGTGMTTDWDHQNAGPQGACYRALVEDTKLAIAKAAEKGIKLRLRAFVWVQGESDANARNAPVYGKNLGEMIKALRADLNAPEMMALVGVNTNFGAGKKSFMPVIVQQQQDLAKNLPHCAYVDTSGVTYARGTAHFDTKSTIEIGRRFANALVASEKNASSAPGASAKPAQSNPNQKTHP